ncbi:MAG: SurA N-terminal domain-containing protein [Treponema sp.]|nr:SurA N-terminal domain-containing protein [Treponema sp.]
MKKTLFVILGVITTVSLFAQAGLQPAATINLIRTEPITVGQLRTEVSRIESQPQQMQAFLAQLTQEMGRSPTTAESQRRLRTHVLDIMINERLVIQAAERDRVNLTDNELNQQIQQYRAAVAQQLGRQPTDAEFSQVIMNESGLNMNDFRDQLRKQMLVQKYLMHRKGELINSVQQPSEADILAQFNLSRSELVRPETVRCSVIQVSYGADAASRTAARALTDRLFQEIGSNPSRFDEVAARSAAPNSGYQAGDFGFVPRNREAFSSLGQEFMNVVFGLQQGQVSRIIEGLQGFQIVKVTENYAHRVLELDDILQPGRRGTVREHIGQMLFAQRQQAILAQATQELITELRTGNPFQIFESNLNW